MGELLNLGLAILLAGLLYMQVRTTRMYRFGTFGRSANSVASALVAVAVVIMLFNLAGYHPPLISIYLPALIALAAINYVILAAHGGERLVKEKRMVEAARMSYRNAASEHQAYDNLLESDLIDDGSRGALRVYLSHLDTVQKNALEMLDALDAPLEPDLSVDDVERQR